MSETKSSGKEAKERKKPARKRAMPTVEDILNSEEPAAKRQKHVSMAQEYQDMLLDQYKAPNILDRTVWRTYLQRTVLHCTTPDFAAMLEVKLQTSVSEAVVEEAARLKISRIAMQNFHRRWQDRLRLSYAAAAAEQKVVLREVYALAMASRHITAVESATAINTFVVSFVLNEHAFAVNDVHLIDASLQALCNRHERPYRSFVADFHSAAAVATVEQRRFVVKRAMKERLEMISTLAQMDQTVLLHAFEWAKAHLDKIAGWKRDKGGEFGVLFDGIDEQFPFKVMHEHFCKVNRDLASNIATTVASSTVVKHLTS